MKRVYGDVVSIDELRSKLPSGTFDTPELWGFAFRVIGHRGEGLPWCEASVLPLDEDKRAQRLRKIETALEAEGTRPALGTEFADAFLDSDELDVENIDAEKLKPYLGENFLKQTEDREDLAYYVNTGAWYNTRKRFKTDDSGYVYSDHFTGSPGRKYVLYLWSNSRNDLEPDARIVFEATGDLTDLGAIELPTYSK